MKYFKQARKYAGTVRKYAGTALAASALVVGFGAYAELPAGVAAGFTQIQTDGLAMADLAWPVVIAFTVALILFKLYKRLAGKV